MADASGSGPELAAPGVCPPAAVTYQYPGPLPGPERQMDLAVELFHLKPSSHAGFALKESGQAPAAARPDRIVSSLSEDKAPDLSSEA